jgi:methylmalonyl-CoA/ethylmalonyl-CoA epimerase
MFLDHVAVLTTKIELFCKINGLDSHESIEVFEDSGSREQYLDGDGVGGRLLLMQPHGDGPYQRALVKRGPGLHHVGIAVSDLAAALEDWKARGWQVHPASEGTMAPDFGAFLFQRGVPTLIELFVGKTDLIKSSIEVALAADQDVFPTIVGVQPVEKGVTITVNNRVLKML